MGLFSNLFGKKEPEGETATAIVYMHREYLDRHFTELVNSGVTMFITFFPSTHKAMVDRIADENLRKRIFIGSSLSFSDIESIKQFVANPANRIAFAERYPLRKKESELLQQLRSHGIQAHISAFCALDDAIMMRFGGGKTMSLMQRMGMTESEAINHPMITKSIARAQEKTLQKITYEQQAKSPEDWYRLNLPQS